MIPPKRHHHKHHKLPIINNPQARRSSGNTSQQDIQIHNLNLTQQHINAALFNVNSNAYSVQQIIPVSRNSSKSPQLLDFSSTNNVSENDSIRNTHELHMAERLVETAAQQQKNAFQFDTITPKKPPIISPLHENFVSEIDTAISPETPDAGEF